MTDEQITSRDLAVAVQSATLAVQLAELAKDVGQLIGRMDRHDLQHADDQREADRAKIASRRWRIGAAIGALSGFATLGGMVIAVLARLH